MRRIVVLIIFSSLALLSVEAQQFRIMTYNVENAFDTLHDAGHTDEEYLPDSQRHWTRHRMYQKLKGIGKVIAAAGETTPVDIVCLQEVENDSVLDWLTHRTPLASLGYDYVMTHSADERGIDVALIYSPFTFRPVSTESLRATTSSPTRDVLHVCGVALGRDTLHIYVVHLPSQLNGRQSQLNREQVATTIDRSLDSLRAVAPDANIIVLGDFNEGIDSKLFRNHFKQLVNLAPTYGNDRLGSYKYQGQWDTIDQVLISPPLNNKPTNAGGQPAKGMTLSSARILNLPFLLEDDEQYGGTKPFRTFVGYRYNGGFSDHLPVLTCFEITF